MLEDLLDIIQDCFKIEILFFLCPLATVALIFASYHVLSSATAKLEAATI